MDFNQFKKHIVNSKKENVMAWFTANNLLRGIEMDSIITTKQTRKWTLLFQ